MMMARWMLLQFNLWELCCMVCSTFSPKENFAYTLCTLYCCLHLLIDWHFRGIAASLKLVLCLEQVIRLSLATLFPNQSGVLSVVSVV